jgi:hypothetical protein
LLLWVGLGVVEAQCASLVSAQFVEVGGRVVVDAQCASLVSAQFVEEPSTCCRCLRNLLRCKNVLVIW